MKRIIICLSAFLLACSLDACTDSKKPRVRTVSESEVDDATEVTNVVYTKYGIPLPIDLFKYLVAEEIPYNNDLLIPLENMDKYTKEPKQAMALGVYSADIAYCSLYKKQQEVMGYFNCSFKLADKLDISEGFNFRYVERMENNINSADSLSSIAAESYWKACNYLNDNEKNNILPFIIYGGWVESQYLCVASNDLKSTREQIMNQREGLLSLINYLYEVMIESSAFYYNYDIKTLIVKLNNIKKIYDKVSGNNIDAQLYNDICSRIKTMRSELIDPNKN
ncbi:MAG: hypothetical protein J6T96_01940 [Bacteroidales bacterium]|nr:hypothetical protein [Bacteroidales bacterium]MBO7461336.1 hypothetical protein [Bacteroidales bacterium]MBO7566580.1 hypothetical protein [Bacteroidales bacterium]